MKLSSVWVLSAGGGRPVRTSEPLIFDEDPASVAAHRQPDSAPADPST